MQFAVVFYEHICHCDLSTVCKVVPANFSEEKKKGNNRPVDSFHLIASELDIASNRGHCFATDEQQ